MPNDDALYTFGEFQFDPRSGLLTRNGESVRLTPKAAEVLSMLLDQAGQLVSKEDLQRRVWPDTFVHENSLTFHMRLVRRALGDDAGAHRYIETLPKRGYRFVAPVRLRSTLSGSDTQIPPTDAPAADVLSTPDLRRDSIRVDRRRYRVRNSFVLSGFAVLAVAGAASIFGLTGIWGRAGSRPPRVDRITPLTRDAKDKGRSMIVGDSWVLLRTASGQRLVPVADGPTAPMFPLSDFRMLHFSTVRHEFLADRPTDAGGEDGLWAVPLSAGTPRRLGEIRADAVASWSRDGRRIAFVRDRTIFIADASGLNVQRVQTFSGSVEWVRWSPDGRILRFTVYPSADRARVGTIGEIGVDGSGFRRVLEGWTNAADECCGDWTSDGQDFVFETRRGTQTELWTLHRNPDGLFTTGREELHRLTDGKPYFGVPGPSTRQRRIFAIGRTTDGRLLRYDVDARRLVSHLGGIPAFMVDYSRDGQRVTYIMRSDYTLWRANADGTGKRQLTFSPMHVDGCAWSPDGTQIAFRARIPGKRSKIFLISADGGAPQPLTSDDVEQGAPSWSADGRRIAFGDVPEQHGRPSGSERIHLFDVVRHTRTVVPGSSGLWSSRWSPDGRYLAAKTIVGKVLTVFDFQTQRWRTFAADHVGDPTWSRDSRHLYYHVEDNVDWAVMRLRVADGAVERMLDLKEYAHRWTGVSPDGSILLLLDDPGEVYALDLEQS